MHDVVPEPIYDAYEGYTGCPGDGRLRGRLLRWIRETGVWGWISGHGEYFWEPEEKWPERYPFMRMWKLEYQNLDGYGLWFQATLDFLDCPDGFLDRPGRLKLIGPET
jgi:hypothetical protein